MSRFAALFDVPAEVVPAAAPVSLDPMFSAGRDQIFELLERRPCTVQDVALGLGIAQAEAGKYIEDLFARGQVRISTCNGNTCYRAAPG